MQSFSNSVCLNDFEHYLGLVQDSGTDIPLNINASQMQIVKTHLLHGITFAALFHYPKLLKSWTNINDREFF